jgi:hypothetical protein
MPFTSRALRTHVRYMSATASRGGMREKQMTTSDGRENHDLIDALHPTHAQQGEPRRRIHEILQA